MTPLIAAAKYNQEAITTLLKAGADVNAREKQYGATALMDASLSNQNPDVITTLLKAGAKVKAQDKGGGTALMGAAKGNNLKVIMVLLNAGADAKAKDNIGNTASNYAKYNSLLKGTDALKQLEEASK
jgi:ankyrin repeat protein